MLQDLISEHFKCTEYVLAARREAHNFKLMKNFINISWLQIDELNAMAKEHENRPIKVPNGELNKCISKEEEEEEEEGEEGDPLTKKKKKKDPLRCEHKGMDPPIPLFALGLCETCYRFVSNFFLMHYFLLFYQPLIFTIYRSTDYCSLINSLVDLVVVWILLHSSVLRRIEW